MASDKVRQLEDNLSAKVRQLEDNLAFRYIADSDRPTNIEDPEEILIHNRYDEYLKNKDALEGSAIRASATIGPNEDTIIEDVVGGFYASSKLAPIAAAIDDVLPGIPFYDIIPDPPDELPDGGNRMRNAIVAVELGASVPALAKGIYTAGSKGIKAFKKIKEVGLSTAWDDLGMELIKKNPIDKTTGRMNMKVKAYINTRKAIQQLAELRNYNTKTGRRNLKESIESALWKRTPTKIKNWLQDTTPTKSILEAVDYGKKAADRDLYSVEGFKRFIHTVDGQGLVRGQKVDENMPLYKAFRNLVKGRVDSATANKMSILERRADPGVAGYHRGEWDGPYIAIRPSEAAYQRTTGVHEIVHGGQLRITDGRKWTELEHIADQYNLPQSDMRGLVEAFRNWETSYMKKLQPYMRQDRYTGKQIKLTDPNVGITVERGDPKYMGQYTRQAKEFAARFGERRDAIYRTKEPLSDSFNTVWNLPNALVSKGAKDNMATKLRILDDLTTREHDPIGLSAKGIDYATKKLWMAAPAIPAGLDEDLFKEIKE